jgi:hypothetical protein
MPSYLNQGMSTGSLHPTVTVLGSASIFYDAPISPIRRPRVRIGSLVDPMFTQPCARALNAARCTAAATHSVSSRRTPGPIPRDLRKRHAAHTAHDKSGWGYGSLLSQGRHWRLWPACLAQCRTTANTFSFALRLWSARPVGAATRPFRRIRTKLTAKQSVSRSTAAARWSSWSAASDPDRSSRHIRAACPAWSWPSSPPPCSRRP